MANAGPEASARNRASQIKANRRRMAREIGHSRLICNYGARTFVHCTNRQPALVDAEASGLIQQHKTSILLEKYQMKIAGKLLLALGASLVLGGTASAGQAKDERRFTILVNTIS